MMCGSKCFLVEMSVDGTKQLKQVIARNSIGARKIVRGEFGTEAAILSVKEKKRFV